MFIRLSRSVLLFKYLLHGIIHMVLLLGLLLI